MTKERLLEIWGNKLNETNEEWEENSSPYLRGFADAIDEFLDDIRELI